MVRCISCKHFHEVFAYRAFNWIPPRRLTTEMALLNALIALLIVCTVLPHHSLAAHGERLAAVITSRNQL